MKLGIVNSEPFLNLSLPQISIAEMLENLGKS